MEPNKLLIGLELELHTINNQGKVINSADEILSSPKANNLVPIELIENISSRLIVNSASFNTKHNKITDWVDRVKDSL